MTNVAVICAHPDDETLGCGGTLLKHKADRDTISWIISTGPWKPRFDDAWIDRRRNQIDAVSAAYGIEQVHELDFPTTKLDTVPFSELIDAMREAISAARPEIAYVVHPNDVHSDHRYTFDAAFNVMKPFLGGGVESIYCYETLSSTEMAPPLAGRAFTPNAFSRIDDHIEKKLDILDLYEGEVFPAPHPRSRETLSALARYRGAAAGCAFAEAFMLMRRTW